MCCLDVLCMFTKCCRIKHDKSEDQQVRLDQNKVASTMGSKDASTTGTKDASTTGTKDASTTGSKDAPTTGTKDASTTAPNQQSMTRIVPTEPSKEENMVPTKPKYRTELTILFIDGAYKDQTFNYSFDEKNLEYENCTNLTKTKRLKIGADEDECQLVLDKDDEISGEHAQINFDDSGSGDLFLIDLDSTNGTKICDQDDIDDENAVKYGDQPFKLSNGDVIKLGSFSYCKVTIT